MAAAQTAADQGAALNEEGCQGPYGAEHAHGDCSVGGHLPDGDGHGLSSMNRGNLRHPKTKKYLVTEWLNDKIPGGEKVHQDVPVERPLRITTDPTVLATTLNMLPGLSHSSLICTTPRHYIRFGSPFNPERRRPRPLQMDGTYGCFKKRWIKQVEDESCMASLEDGTESISSQQSTSSRSTPNPLCSEVNAPFKKRHLKYLTEMTPSASDHLLHPLSPITPPLPEDNFHPLLHTPSGSLLANGLVYSPMPSLPTSRCNTPFLFENISSPEASPVHRPESISPEPCLQADFDVSRPQFPDLSLPSSLESPVAMTSDDFSLPGVASGQDSQVSCPSSDSQNREQTFRTEFNLIYTCSPLNANLGTPVTSDRRLSQLDGGFSPADSLHSSISGQGLVGDLGSGSMSPYTEPHYGAGYPDSSTPPHTSNPPQKKKVSLLEYRKRKQGSGREPETPSAAGPPHTRPGPHLSKDSPLPHPHQQMQPPVSPHSLPSSAHASIPHIEELSPEQHGPAGKRHPETNNQWMVPTTVERLREGQGVLERVLRTIKMERSHKRSDGSSEKDSDAERYEMQAAASSSRSPHRYSPPLYSHQQTSSSPFRGSISPSSAQSFYPRLPSSSSHPGLTHDPPQTSYSSPSSCSDSRQPGGPQHQQSGGGVDGGLGYSGAHLKANLLNSSGLAGAVTAGPKVPGQTKTDSAAAAPRGAPQQAPRGLKSGSPGQAGLPAGSRLPPASGATHYSQRGGGLGQFQHSPLQGPGVRTQSGSF